MNGRGIPSIQYAQSTQLEGLRRMQHDRDSKTRPIIQWTFQPPNDEASMRGRREAAIRADPCGVLGHTPAYLAAGGIACYVCGARYV